MALEIVWRNSIPITSSRGTVERVACDGIGAVYALRGGDVTETFELIIGGGA
jgi:hypothetical protein